MMQSRASLAWFARAAVGCVFFINITCAIAFILRPENYAGGFEISGIPGKVAVQGFGFLFLMWNVTYPPVMFQPERQMLLYSIILIQQAIGLVGESWMYMALPTGHAALRATGLRFIFFDGIGLLMMGAAFVLLRRVK